MRSFLNGFHLGLNSALMGGQLLFRVPRALWFALWPILINTVLLIAGILSAIDWLPAFVYGTVLSIFPGLSGLWWHVIYLPALVLTWVAYILICLILIYVLAGIIAGPFLSLLSERVLDELSAFEQQRLTFRTVMARALKMAWLGLVRAVLFGILAILVFILSLIPGLNIIALLITVMMLAYDSVDYSLEALNYDLTSRFRYFIRHFPEFCGFGVAVTLTFLIPVLNFVFIPAAVAGGAQLVAEIKKRTSSESS